MVQADDGQRVLDAEQQGLEHTCGMLQQQFGVQLTLDGGADAVGSNRQLHRFCSVVDNILTTI